MKLNLKKKREEKKLSQRELQKISGIAHNTISQYENNKRKIPLKNAIILAEKLEIKIEELYEE